MTFQRRSTRVILVAKLKMEMSRSHVCIDYVHGCLDNSLIALQDTEKMGNSAKDFSLK